MGENSKIEWTHHTFNPWRGCEHAAMPDGTTNPLCDHCYAEAMAKRNPQTLGTWGGTGTRVVAAESYWQLPLKWNRQAEVDGERKRVFCASLADVFESYSGHLRTTNDCGALVCKNCMAFHSDECDYSHCDCGQPIDWMALATMDDARRRLFADICAKTPWLDKLLLTKRPELILSTIERVVGIDWWMEHCADTCWLGTSAGTQSTADVNIPELLKCRDLAPVLFLSAEPLLEAVNLDCVPWPSTWDRPIDDISDGIHALRYEHGHLDWIICGGESGHHARPMHPDWARSLRDQCAAAGVPFLFKQWGEWLPVSHGGSNGALHEWEDGESSINVGKKLAGRLLDGQEWNQFPDIRSMVNE